jgi:membrane-bound lytic murein transglycosylase D
MSKILSIVFVFFSLSVLSQDAFFASRSHVMNEATNQWLVTELEKNNPAAFSDNQGGKSVIRIPVGTSPIAQLNSTYDVALANKFSQVYFPNGKADRFLKINSLCNLYFPLVERKLLNAKLPLEYKYLPLVMTGFNATYEDERDRAGMWALEFLSARKWKLQIDTLVDERRGGDITTDAAVKELLEIHNHFNGKVASVLKAWYISRAYAEKLHNKRTLTEDELDAEANLFVEFFIFSARLFSENQNNASNQLNAYFDILGNFESIAFKDTVNISGLVSLVGLDENILRKTNPVYIGRYIDPVYRRVTFIMDNRFSGKFRQLEDSVYRWQPPVKPVVYTELIEEEEKIYHVVRKGEALGTIARKHKVSIINIPQ